MNRTIRRNPAQSMLDAVALTVLLLLVLTVRFGPENPVADLVPDSEASQSNLDAGSTPVARPGVGALAAQVERAPLGPDFVSIDGSGPGRTVCRITRIGNEVETSCIRVDEAATEHDAANLGLVTSCAATRHEQS